eukprot:TRINITY_DN40142_c0_g1_i1.p1 TRINITY_DN40142_c0_g1~~TRINITY_DN40142_c0_g1_i1.p1  ORF type:complete len:1169 (+),score=128.70 TRINITY_DN40142_c0_g1_i1:98-3604(+)
MSEMKTNQGQVSPERRPQLRRISTAWFQPQETSTVLDDCTLERMWLPRRKGSLFHAILKEFINKSVRIVTANGWPTEADTVGMAVASLADDLRRSASTDIPPSVVIVLVSEILDPIEVLDEVQQHFPHTPNLHGATTALGITTQDGFRSTPTEGGFCPLAIGLWAIFDPLGSYVTVGLPLAPAEVRATDRAEFIETRRRSCVASTSLCLSASSSALERLFFRLDRAYRKLREKAQRVVKLKELDCDDRIGQEPLSEHLFIWMTALPFLEEHALDALYDWGHSRFGRSIPVVGGSAADSCFGGNWFSFCRTGDETQVFRSREKEGMVVTLMASSVKTHPLFTHPFTPMNEIRAKVVSCGPTEHQEEAEGRVISKLQDVDGTEHSAGSLYHAWCEDFIEDSRVPPPKVAEGLDSFESSVLSASSLCPLGVEVASEGDSAFDYRILHPSGLYKFTSIDTGDGKEAYMKAFASVKVGQNVVLLKARKRDLVDSLARLNEQLALEMDMSSVGNMCELGSPDASRIAGALMTYCAGCLMGLRTGSDANVQMRQLSGALQKVFCGQPFMAMHPFGEQGYFRSSQKSFHANLMWSGLVFTTDPSFELDGTQEFSAILSDLLSNAEPSCRRSKWRSQTLRELLMRGPDVDWAEVRQLVASRLISIELLKELTLCAAQPFRFSLHAAELFTCLAGTRASRAREYHEAADWHKAFCSDFLAAASLRQIDLGSVLEDTTLIMTVSKCPHINAKSIASTHVFQVLIQDMWDSGGHSQTCLKRLLRDEFDEEFDGNEAWGWGPSRRYNANTVSYSVLVLTQAVASLLKEDTFWMWLVIVIWTFGYLAMTIAAPASGFFTRFSMARNLVLVGALICISVESLFGRKVPADLVSVTFLIHFMNIAQLCVVHQSYGPLIIMVQRMAFDVLVWLGAFCFCVVAFYFVLRSLYARHSLEFAGETYGLGPWHGTVTLLVNYVGCPQFLWTMVEPALVSDSTTMLSRLFGIRDAVACDIVGFCVMIIAWLMCCLLMINLLLAMMTASYSRVLKDSDLECKWSQASAVLVAREMSWLPIPFNLFDNVSRLVWYLLTKRDAVSFGGPSVRGSLPSDVELAIVHGTTDQMVLQWETQKVLDSYKTLVSMEELNHMRAKLEAIAVRVNAVGIATNLNSSKLVALRLQSRMRQS